MSRLLPRPTHKNPRGIPQAPFISAVTDYAHNLDEANVLLGELQEMNQKYQLMKIATENRRNTATTKLPTLRESLEVVIHLQKQREPFDMQYQLNETVYAKAEIHPTNSVWIWLGANIMLEYDLEEGREMLAGKVKDGEELLRTCNEDLEFLRENITTTEVNSARVINWQVEKRKNLK